MSRSLVVYVDVDDTIVRSAGTKRIPTPGVIAHVRDLHAAGATLYCWSTGGADYARSAAEELGLAACFSAFLPKPDVMVDDQSVAEWRSCIEIGPMEAISASLESYRSRLGWPGTEESR